MKKIELKYNNWNQVPIAVYDEIVEIVNDEALSDFEKNLSLLSLLTGESEDDIANLPIADVNNLTNKTKWLNNFDFDKKWTASTIKINGNTYGVNINLNDFTYAQYIDFQNLYPTYKKNLAELLSVFIIPKGKKYNDGYDIAEVQKEIRNNLSITMSQSILFFFLQRLASSINFIKTYLGARTKMMRMKNWVSRKKMNETEMQMMNEVVKQLKMTEQMLYSVGSLYSTNTAN